MLQKIKKAFMKIGNELKKEPVKISLLYFIISFLWILISDRLVQQYFTDNKLWLFFSTFKGWVYVIVITLILYFLLSRAFRRLSASEEKLRRQFYQIKKLAYNDSTTELPNRLWLQENLTQLLQAPSKIALLFIDLDNFKYINDSFGHSFGDTVLAKIGDRLSDISDTGNIVARLGGDEFAVVVKDFNRLIQIDKFAQDILTRLETSFREKDINLHLTASIGIAIYPDHAGNFEELLKNADTAMYKAKKQGKNQFVIFDQSMNRELFSKVAMEGNLRAAIDNNELMLYYQPVYSLKSSKICGFEALARWNSPIYGMVPPSVFIPLAEETGLIYMVGNWVLDTACKFISRFNSLRTDKFTISINVSVHQLTRDSFVADVIHILEKNGVEAQFLELEITESILMEDVELNLKKIDILEKQGIRVALDDFGTGYSSLTYLKKLPISILKLDKAFIDDIAVSKADSEIVKSIIMLAETLDLLVIAEGVEEKDQLDCLAGYGCDMIQGYYISRPLPEEGVEQLLQSGE